MKDAQKLVAAHLDGSLNAVQQEELAAWLRKDAAHLRAFTEAVMFEQQVRAAVQAAELRAAAAPFADAGTGAETVVPVVVRRVAWLAVAACVTLLGGAIWFSQRPSPPPATAWLAEVTTLRGAAATDDTTWRTGQRLVPGRIAIVAGAMELLLANGVRVVFEGPGEMELLSPMRTILHSGQAVVRVPGNAKGFRLETASAQIVDLGTEFGVKCGPAGVTDVLVFDGEVTASGSIGSAGFPQQLRAGQARRFSPGHTQPEKIAYLPERFVRRISSDKPIELEENNSPLFNSTRFEEIAVTQPEQPIVVDGDLSEWSDAGSFRAARAGTSGQFVEGRMRYDERFFYIAAHIGDPAPLKNVIDPATDGESGWRGGGLQVRLSTDRSLGWPVDANAPNYYQFRRIQPDAAHLANSTSDALVHLTMWRHAPSAQNCLHVAYGMDFHGGGVNPPGYRAAFRKDADGRGYTLEYAVPWSLLGAVNNPPRAGDTLAVSWTTHWSDEGGRLWRGQLVELRNASEPPRIHTWERAATWGRALYR